MISCMKEQQKANNVIRHACLSHCTVHVQMLKNLTDHTGGLSPSWNLGPIYCSPITKQLLMHKFQLPDTNIVCSPNIA